MNERNKSACWKTNTDCCHTLLDYLASAYPDQIPESRITGSMEERDGCGILKSHKEKVLFALRKSTFMGEYTNFLNQGSLNRDDKKRHLRSIEAIINCLESEA